MKPIETILFEYTAAVERWALSKRRAYLAPNATQEYENASFQAVLDGQTVNRLRKLLLAEAAS